MKLDAVNMLRGHDSFVLPDVRTLQGGYEGQTSGRKSGIDYGHDTVLASVLDRHMPVARLTGMVSEPVVIVTVEDSTVTEGEVVMFTVTLSEPWDEELTYFYRTLPSYSGIDDYRSEFERLTFAPGMTSIDVRIYTMDDVLYEMDGEFHFYIATQWQHLQEVDSLNYDYYVDPHETFAPLEYIASSTVTIQDNDPLVVTVADATAMEGHTLRFGVEIPYELSVFPFHLVETVTYWYSDYLGSAGVDDYVRPRLSSVTFSPGESIRAIDIVIPDDEEFEEDEEFYLYIAEHPWQLIREPTDAAQYVARAKGIIRDSNPRFSVADATVLEGDDLRFVVTVDREIDEALTVWYEIHLGLTASGSDLFVGDGSVTFLPDGERSKVAGVSVFEDSIAEPEEQFYLYLLDAERPAGHGEPVDYISRAVGTIIDDEGLPVYSDPRNLPVYSTEQIADELLRYNERHDSTRLGVDISQLTAPSQDLVRQALARWSDVANVEFVVYTQAGDEADIAILIRHAPNDEREFSSTHTPFAPEGISLISSALVEIYTIQYPEARANSMWVYLHEIGHALGLAHPGRYNGDAAYGEHNHYLNDSMQASLMSYFRVTQNHFFTDPARRASGDNVDFKYPVTPMIADILAIQRLYGPPVSSQPGDTVYGARPDILGEFAYSTEIAFTIYDTDGMDTIDFSSFNANQSLDLRARAVSDVRGGRGNMVIADDTVIENAIGGSGDDIITGNHVANRLLGGAGADHLLGGAGADHLLGEAGADHLTGGAGADHLTGGAGADHLTGGEGADTFVFVGPQDSLVASPDMILDFSGSTGDGDRIDLSGFAEFFLGEGPFLGVQGDVRYEQDHTKTTILVDTDGDQTPDFAAVLAGLHDLSVGDFVLSMA